MSDIQTTWTDEQGETWVPFSDYMALSAALKTERNKALREAVRLVRNMEEGAESAWRDGRKSDTHLEGQSDGLAEAVEALKALIPPIPAGRGS